MKSKKLQPRGFTALVCYHLLDGDHFDIQLMSYSEESLHQDALFIFSAMSHICESFDIYPFNH